MAEIDCGILLFTFKNLAEVKELIDDIDGYGENDSHLIDIRS